MQTESERWYELIFAPSQSFNCRLYIYTNEIYVKDMHNCTVSLFFYLTYRSSSSNSRFTIVKKSQKEKKFRLQYPFQLQCKICHTAIYNLLATGIHFKLKYEYLIKIITCQHMRKSKNFFYLAVFNEIL